MSDRSDKVDTPTIENLRQVIADGNLMLIRQYLRDSEGRGIFSLRDDQGDLLEYVLESDLWREVLMLFVECGEDLESIDNGDSLLLRVCRYWGSPQRCEQLMKFLLDDCRLNVVAENTKGWGALGQAAYCLNLPAIKILVQRGADIDRQSPESGNTPLHELIESPTGRSPEEAVRFLLAAGAAAELRNRKGLTAAAEAAARGQHESAQIIRSVLAEKHKELLEREVKQSDVMMCRKCGKTHSPNGPCIRM